jgi:hypothetical protein
MALFLLQCGSLLLAHRVISLLCGIWSLSMHSGLRQAVHPARRLQGLDQLELGRTTTPRRRRARERF